MYAGTMKSHGGSEYCSSWGRKKLQSGGSTNHLPVWQTSRGRTARFLAWMPGCLPLPRWLYKFTLTSHFGWEETRVNLKSTFPCYNESFKLQELAKVASARVRAASSRRLECGFSRASQGRISR